MVLRKNNPSVLICLIYYLGGGEPIVHDLDLGFELILKLLKIIIWIVAWLLMIAGLRLLLLTTSLELAFIKQRLTAWVANLRMGLYYLAAQAFCLNLAMALRVIVRAREVEIVFHYSEHILFLFFEIFLLVGLLIMGNVLRGGGPSSLFEYKEVSQIINGLDANPPEDDTLSLIKEVKI